MKRSEKWASRADRLPVDLALPLLGGAVLQINGGLRVWGFFVGRFGWLTGPVLGLLLFATGSLLLVGGCYLYLRRMAHPPAWALLGLLNVPGALAVLTFFDDKPPPAGPPGFEVLPKPPAAWPPDRPSAPDPEPPP